MSSCPELFPVTQGSILLEHDYRRLQNHLHPRLVSPNAPSVMLLHRITHIHPSVVGSVQLIGATVAIKPNRANGRQPTRATL